MASTSTIEWTDATWNPVTGCRKVSPGCKNCYAETFAERFRGVPGHHYEQGFDLRIWPSRLALPEKWRTPRRIFVNSMSDLFQDGVPLEFVEQVFDVMRAARHHQFQVLTKRPERMLQFLDELPWAGELGGDAAHIWLGSSVETQAYVWRAELVAQLPSAVRFLSCEPLLGELDLSAVLEGPQRVNWVIVGGESGSRARSMDASWATAIRDACVSEGVPFFFKQWGGKNKKAAGRELGGRTWDQMPASR